MKFRSATVVELTPRERRSGGPTGSLRSGTSSSSTCSRRKRRSTMARWQPAVLLSLNPQPSNHLTRSHLAPQRVEVIARIEEVDLRKYKLARRSDHPHARPLVDFRCK